MLSSSYTATSCERERRGEKQNAVVYAAKEVHGGMAVTRPPWIDAFWTAAMMQRNSAASAKVSKMYLANN
jgi:hypothetical protein